LVIEKLTNEVVLIQPPFVQLNSPYPAPYYLKAFLEQRGFRVTVLDHSIGLFERIFSRAGLESIFTDAALLPANNSEVERFLSEKNLWCASIDRLIAFLRQKDHEWGHFLALANGCLPSGKRTDAFIAERGGEVSVNDAGILATKLLADLADFITFTLDENFSLIRYRAAGDACFSSFTAVQKTLDGYIMKNFYRPLLEDEWKKLENSVLANNQFLLGVTIPFPGCLQGALVCAESVKKHFGKSVRTVAGGGYVNTELRFLSSKEFNDYFDYVSFDKGYSALISILENNKIDEATEDTFVKTTFPDYSEVDFSRYLYPVDDANSMHRLWSDGHWLKAYLAHGCYWHSCAFCDVTLDYIKNFIPVDTPALFSHLKKQAEKTGVRGIHFCDEAAPVSSLLEFALLNREAGAPLNFWGNIRFERNYDPDTAAILAAGGLLGVSAGLEVATEKGFKRLGKGIDLESAVSALAAFKEAGILTHAYLIYGYWDEDEEELINSAETLRQLFAEGLLDSAFWHKFILTRHSRIYAEKERGLHPLLKVKVDYPQNDKIFALNDLSFEGEERFDKYGEGLETLLGAWMAGVTEMPVSSAFSFKVKAPSVPPDLVSALLDKYARTRDKARTATPKNDRVLFLGTIPRRQEGAGKNVPLFWHWRTGECKLGTAGKTEAEKTVALLQAASTGKGMDAKEFYASLVRISGEDWAMRSWKRLRESGLCCYCAVADLKTHFESMNFSKEIGMLDGKASFKTSGNGKISEKEFLGI
jgi:radical SAM superfamily enzyme YgiQ (UPF0313 family)